MRRHRVVALRCVDLSFALLVTATTSFTSVTAERDTSVGVAGESNAYPVAETDDQTVMSEDDTEIDLSSLSNNFEAPLTDIDVSLTGENAGPPRVSKVGLSAGCSLGARDSGDIEATVACGDSYFARDTIPVEIETSGPSRRLGQSR